MSRRWAFQGCTTMAVPGAPAADGACALADGRPCRRVQQKRTHEHTEAVETTRMPKRWFSMLASRRGCRVSGAQADALSRRTRRTPTGASTEALLDFVQAARTRGRRRRKDRGLPSFNREAYAATSTRLPVLIDDAPTLCSRWLRRRPRAFSFRRPRGRGPPDSTAARIACWPRSVAARTPQESRNCLQFNARVVALKMTWYW